MLEKPLERNPFSLDFFGLKPWVMVAEMVTSVSHETNRRPHSKTLEAFLTSGPSMSKFQRVKVLPKMKLSNLEAPACGREAS